MRSLLFAWCDSGWNASEHADVVVRAVRALGHHDVRRDARDVRLIREVDQVEHQLHLLVEVRQLADRRIGQIDRGEVALRRLRDAPLRLAHGLEVVVEHTLVGGAQLALQSAVRAADHVEHARAALREHRALLGRVAGAEQLREHLARVELHRQRRRRVAERQRRAVVARAASRTRRSASSSRYDTSSDGSTESPPIFSAIIWSIVGAIDAPVAFWSGCTPESHVAGTIVCTEPCGALFSRLPNDVT